MGAQYGNMVTDMATSEWRRGPRPPEEAALQEEPILRDSGIPLDSEDASPSVRPYRTMRRPRGRKTDLAIAAGAVNRNMRPWTKSRADFADIRGVTLYSA